MTHILFIATGSSHEPSVADFVKFLKPFFGNGDCDDLLNAFMLKLEMDKARETGKGEIDFNIGGPVLKAVSTVEEVSAAVLQAKKDKHVLRVAGSEHAPGENIFPQEQGGVTLLLCDDLRKVDMMKEVEEDGKKYLYCKVGAGCYLGKNPSDKDSTTENGMCYQIKANGYAFGITGGITHQSVGGYIATGADGGTIQHSFAETVQEIEFVDGMGEVQVASKGTDIWCAIGVSMGLLGVITNVTFRLGETYLVKGTQFNVEFNDSYLGPTEGDSRLKESIDKFEYFHLNWFPQKHVNRVMQWVGGQVQEADIVPFRNTLGNPLAAAGAALVLTICNRLLVDKPGEITYDVIGYLLRQFVSLKDTQNFADAWDLTLPSDNQTPVDTIIKVDFTEVWLPLDQCQPVMDKLKELFKNQQAAGNFATEIYCAKESPFWMSMAYGRNVVRVDRYWYHYNEGDLRTYFSYFWDVLLELPGARLHWGKYLPHYGQKCGDITYDLEHLNDRYPKLKDWLKKRDELDPDQVFLSEYWRSMFQIAHKE